MHNSVKRLVVAAVASLPVSVSVVSVNSGIGLSLVLGRDLKTIFKISNF